MKKKMTVILTLTLGLLAACFSPSSRADLPTGIAAGFARILARTAVETAGSLLFEETYDRLKQAFTKAGPGAGLTDFSVGLHAYSDTRYKRTQSIYQYEIRSVLPNPATGSLSYFYMLTTGYTNVGMPPKTSYNGEPFSFSLRNLTESCTDASMGMEYRRSISTTLLARHSYAAPPWFPPSSYVVYLGLAHTPVPSDAPCNTGVSSPAAGVVNTMFSIAPYGATVLQLPSSITPNAITDIRILSAFPAPRGTPVI
jgi:hypothetical protein